MKEPLFLDAFAALLPSGMYSSRGFVPWQSGQDGPRDVSREQVLDKPYPGFGKLHIADRLSFAAAALLFSHYGAVREMKQESPWASRPVHFQPTWLYMDSLKAVFPVPSIFSATLPSSALADIAIYFKIKGPNRVIAGASGSGLCAFDLAAMMLHRGKASSMLVVSVNAIEPAHMRSSLLPAYAAVGKPRVLHFCLPGKKKGKRPAFLPGNLFWTGVEKNAFRTAGGIVF